MSARLIKNVRACGSESRVWCGWTERELNLCEHIIIWLMCGVLLDSR